MEQSKFPRSFLLEFSSSAEAFVTCKFFGNFDVIKQAGHGLFFEGNIFQVSGESVTNKSDAAIATILLDNYFRRGSSFFAHIVGEFTLVIWSQREAILYRNITCSRPLYYTPNFACNHLLPLTKIERHQDLNTNYVQHFLLRNFLLPHQFRETPFKGISQIPAGNYLRVGINKSLTLNWVEIPSLQFQCLKVKDPQEIALGIQKIMCDSINDRLDRAGNNKIVCEISGGLDSSFVASIIGQQRQNVSGYMFSYPEHPSHRSSETYAREVADKYGIALTILPPETFFPYDLSAPLPYTDEPSPFAWQAALLWTKITAFVGPKSTIFSGVGSDQLFMRTPMVLHWLFKEGMFQEYFSKLFECSTAMDRSAASLMYQTLLSVVPPSVFFWLRSVLKILPRNLTSFEDVMLFHGVDRAPWVKGGEKLRFKVTSEENSEQNKIFGRLAPIRGSLSSLILPHLSMGGIISARGIHYEMPFYDVRLLNFVYSEIPWHLVHDWKNPYKNLLREAEKGIVPEQTRNRPKNEFHFEGFLGRLFTENREYIRGLVFKHPFQRNEIFDEKALQHSLEMNLFCSKPDLDNIAFVNFVGYLLWLRDFQATANTSFLAAIDTLQPFPI